MDQFIQSLQNIIEWLQPATWVLCAVALVVNGVLMAVGGDEGRQKAKKALPWVAVGCVIILLAVNIGKEFVEKVAF